MDRSAGIAQIKQACNHIALELMKIHPAVPALGDRQSEAEIYQRLFAITKELEAMKKRLLRLEKREDQPDL